MSKKKNKSGFSLIEIMLSILILALLALGGSAILFRTGASVQVQGTNRVVSELVNSFLEEQQTKAFDLDTYVQLSGFSTNLVLDGISYPVDVAVSNVLVEVYDSGVVAYASQKEITISTVFRGQSIQVSSTVIPSVGIQVQE